MAAGGDTCTVATVWGQWLTADRERVVGPSAAVVRIDLGAREPGERTRAIGGPRHARPVVVRLPAGGSLPAAASIGWNTVGHSPAAK